MFAPMDITAAKETGRLTEYFRHLRKINCIFVFFIQNRHIFLDVAMILEFRMRNYRSFREEAVLSMVASADNHLRSKNILELNNSSIKGLVRSAVIYGANASGKSNLLRGMNLMRLFVLKSASHQPGQTLNIQPFKLDAHSPAEPTLFEITVILKGIRYQYGFEVTSERVVGEWLLVYKSARPQTWIDRKFAPETDSDDYEMSSYVRGRKIIWQESTLKNQLLLSKAVSLNAVQFEPLFSWFRDELVVMPEGGQIAHNFSTDMIEDRPRRQKLISMLTAADIGISDISAVRQKGYEASIEIGEDGLKANTKVEEREMLLPRFTHEVGETNAEFEFTDESLGTQKLFSLAGPLLDILEAGKVLVIDELDRSLHPLLVRHIVQVFQDNELNPNGAQLIFTTHDTSLLDSTLLRRDQIWLTEKASDQTTQLIPLSIFSPRKNEALERGYLGGRYGGVPILAERLIERGNSE
jgi:AAA15 family ATPase/GTPase